MSVDYVLEDDLAIVTLNRPDRYNAIDASLGEGLIRAATRAGEEARALVLTGAGKAFCSGADLNDLMADYVSGDGPDLSRLLEEVFHPALQALLDCEVPVVGAINGVAAGAGLGFALACDIRVMADEAFLTSAFTAIGLVPDSGTTWWLSHHLGVSQAIEIAFTNRRVGAKEARELGLCVDVVPGDQLIDRARSLAGQLADLVPESLVATRRLIREASGVSLDEALKAEQKEQGRLGKTPEHREGVMAFIEKRKPDFRA
ncbi:MAG: enoyl-CoA hydratase-related protein [Acidimicrobiia bacterium]|jgi:2-(1,2-epoxy-1,2-dihydrophenyl)acetyl-CoA isomerase